MKNMPKFSIVCIMRNEAKTLPRLAESLKEFLSLGGDWVCMDTGSTDDSVKVAKSLGAKVTEVGEKFLTTIDKKTADNINKKFVAKGEKKVIANGNKVFDFSAARNHAASLAENDMVSCIDCDEAFTKLDIEKIEKLIDGGNTKFSYHFIFSHKPDGSEDISFTQSKFYDRRDIKWQNIIHEYLTGKVAKQMYLPTDIFHLEHWQNAETNRTGYLKGLALDCWNHLDYDRNSHYFAREMYYHGMNKSAIREFKRHIKMKGWPAERAHSMILMGDCYDRLGKPEKAVSCWHEAFELEPNRREALMHLAWFWYKKSNWQKAAAYANAALTISRNDFYSNFTGHYTNEPHEILYVSLFWLGDKKGSKQHFIKALEYCPNHPKYLNDRQFYGMSEYSSPDIEGWMTPVELDFLHSEAKKHGTICEVGSWKGRSTHALLTGANGIVTAVDHFKGSDDEGDLTKKMGEEQDIYSQFMNNVGHLPNLKVVRKDSLTAAKEMKDEKFSLVFVDAEHTYEGVKADIEAWKDKAEVVLCGHDYCDAWPGVVKAVDEAFGKPDEVHGSVWVKRIFPKVLHHIWVGPKPVPMEWIQTWYDKHPDWQHIIWDNDKVFGRKWRNQKLVDHYASKKMWHGVADVIRYEILYEFGGFMPGTDSECLRPIDELFDDPKHDAWGVYENEKVKPGFISPLYACRKSSSFALSLIDGLQSQPDADKMAAGECDDEPWWWTGNYFMQRMAESLKYPRLMVFPSHYFSPVHHTGETYKGDFKPYSTQLWGTTKDIYDK